MENHNEGIPKNLAQHATPLRGGQNYQPPEGAKIIKPAASGQFYDLGNPSAQTDRLQAYERRYVIPVAMSVATAFDVMPIHDDVYRHIGEYPKSHNLFCVMSRSNIKRTGDYLDWDPVVVVVKKFVIVKVNCHLYPNKPDFVVRRLWLWNSKDQEYAPVGDDQSKRVDPALIPYIMGRYIELEDIQ